MANISEFLQKILSARFGEDVRRSIHDAIEEIDKVAETAQESATAMAQIAENKANEASGYASSAKTSESNAKSYMESTKNSETNAKSSETAAKTSETNAKTSETNAKFSENAASDSAVIAQNKASEAEQSASGAANSALSASRSESNANTSAENAKDSENNADYYSKLSKSYAVGETSERPGEDNDNSKYYSETAKTEADRAKAEADRAQRIAGGDYVTNTQIKDYSLIKDTGYELALSIDNSTYVMTISLKNATGDILSSKSIDFPIESMVVNATYQNGKITLTLQNGNSVDVDVSALVSGLVKDTFTIAGIDMKDNITASELKVALGLDKVANVAVNDQAPTFTAASSRENIASGEKLSVLFGKIMKWFADLKNVAFSGSYNDLSNKPSINEVELYGKKTLDDFGIASVYDLNKINNKVDTIIEADLGIKETASGENIHLIDSAEGKAVEISLFGKCNQVTTTGKNLLENTATTQTVNGITFTVNADGSVTADGTATANAWLTVSNLQLPIGDYILNGCPSGGNSNCYRLVFRLKSDSSDTSTVDYGNGGVNFTIKDNTIEYLVILGVMANQTVNNLTFYPMIRLASIIDDTYEPYTGGQPSPSSEYPQDIGVSGESYNILENTATTKTVNGITFTVNDDGTVTANGTVTTSPASLAINYDIRNKLKIGEKYILSGAKGVDNCVVKIALKDGISFKESNNSDTIFTYNGEEIEYVTLLVRDVGRVLNNFVFKPMIRKANVKNDRYMPYYGKGSVEVKSVGKNLLKNEATSQTINGVSFVVNDDGSVTVNGTATANTSFIINTNVELNSENYILNGCPSGGVYNTYAMQIYTSNDGKMGNYINNEVGVGRIIDGNTYHNIYVRIRLESGTTVSNFVFYPMIRLATDTDPTYEPYKETTATIPVTDFAGIPVSSGGNYTDSNGQQWICDEIVKYADGSGEKVQRIGKQIFDGSSDENWLLRYPEQEPLLEIIIDNLAKLNGLCNLYNHTYLTSASSNIGFNTTVKENYIRFRPEDYKTITLEDWKIRLTNNPATVYYILKEPIRTPLTPEELVNISVSTNYPITNISNDFDCGMKIKYNADSKNYVDKNLALQAQAQEETMMSMFMLLPDETQAAMIENDTNNLLLESEE